MRFLLMPVLVATTALPASGQADATPGLARRYSELSRCTDVESAPPDEDWVYKQCRGPGSTAVWYVCTDSTRCRIGFGTRPNVANWMFGVEGFGTWPIEWRGVQRRGRFRPIAAIIRMPSADTTQSARNTLIVYRLRADGTSCIIGEASTNEEARRIADSPAGDFQCVGEPELL